MQPTHRARGGLAPADWHRLRRRRRPPPSTPCLAIAMLNGLTAKDAGPPHLPQRVAPQPRLRADRRRRRGVLSRTAGAGPGGGDRRRLRRHDWPAGQRDRLGPTPRRSRRSFRARPRDMPKDTSTHHRTRQHRGKLGDDPESASRAARRQRGDRPRGARNGSRQDPRPLSHPVRDHGEGAGTWSAAAAAFPAGAAESSITADLRPPAAVRRVADADCRGRAGSGRRAAVSLARASTGFRLVAPHPVVDAYRAYKPMPYDAPAPALAAALYAVLPEEGISRCPGPGRSACLTTAGRGSRRRPMGSIDISSSTRRKRPGSLTQYTSLVSAQPAPRPGRRGGAA